ncbi:hypothetical protein [Pseudomonas putida]|uniref:DUF7830 domain-containing protein n=1 Tax=Pseudomonas putida TaxID=303 RepID=UPI00383A4586
MHPGTRLPIVPEGYEKAFGKPLGPSGEKSDRPDALCSVCGQGVYLRAEHSKQTIPNFAHRRNSDYCPLKDFNANAYRALNPAQGNPAEALQLKLDFFATWKHHWIEFNRIIKYASIKDFCSVLTYANQNRIWYYKGMQTPEVLAVLMTLMDFAPLPKHKRHMRDFGVRFLYQGSVANTEQYWNLPASQRQLLMVKYDFPGTTRTFQEKNVSGRDIVAFDPSYTSGIYTGISQAHEFVEKFMKEKFPNDV